jgi:hypothetical protein
MERRRIDHTITKAMLKLDDVSTQVASDSTVTTAELRSHRKAAVLRLEAASALLDAQCPAP